MTVQRTVVCYMTVQRTVVTVQRTVVQHRQIRPHGQHAVVLSRTVYLRQLRTGCVDEGVCFGACDELKAEHMQKALFCALDQCYDVDIFVKTLALQRDRNLRPRDCFFVLVFAQQQLHDAAHALALLFGGQEFAALCLRLRLRMQCAVEGASGDAIATFRRRTSRAHSPKPRCTKLGVTHPKHRPVRPGRCNLHRRLLLRGVGACLQPQQGMVIQCERAEMTTTHRGPRNTHPANAKVLNNTLSAAVPRRQHAVLQRSRASTPLCDKSTFARRLRGLLGRLRLLGGLRFAWRHESAAAGAWNLPRPQSTKHDFRMAIQNRCPSNLPRTQVSVRAGRPRMKIWYLKKGFIIENLILIILIY